MSTDPRPNAYNNAELDAASTIRFEEPRRVPVGLLAGIGVGVLLVCLILFFVMYKVKTGDDTKPAAKAPAATSPSATGGIQGEVVKSESGKVIPGAVKEQDGELTVSNPPSKCTFLEVHLKNLAEMERENPSPENKAWVEGKRQMAKDNMAALGCK